MNRSTTLTLLLSLIILFIGMPLFAEKSTYKWKSKDGSTQYGDQVPPEESKKAYDVYNSRGNRIKSISRTKTQEEYQIEDKRLRRLRILKKIAIQKLKEDQRLLRLYPNEDAVIHARDERISAIQNGIALSADVLKLYQGNISSLRKSAAEHERARKPIPLTVKRRIASYRKMLQEIETSISAGKIKQQKIRLNYEKILSRYREIK